jgi:hypothetical protein
MRSRPLSRRTLLRGALGTAVALPFLEAMGASRAQAARDPVRRLVFISIPVGFKDAATYRGIERPSAAGLPYTLPQVLRPLESVQSKLALVGNLENHACEGGNGDAHDRGSASLLTCRPARLSGSVVTNGISVDQLAAQNVVGPPLSSIEVGVDDSMAVGKSLLSSSISWRADGTPAPKEISPARLWDRLFSDLSLSPQELALKRAQRQSILHYAQESAQSLRPKLSASDRQRLDQYLTGVEELEARIRATDQCPVPLPSAPASRYDHDGSLGNHDRFGVTAHHDLMLDLIAHALACDLTRVASFMFVSGTFADWRFLGFQDEHHLMSHYPEEYADRLDAICTWEMERLARFLEKLDSIEDVDGSTVLDNTLVFVSSEVAQGKLHNYDDLPVFLAGGGNQVTKTGQYVRAATPQPLANLFTSMLHFAGVKEERFGTDGTGPLDAIMV